MISLKNTLERVFKGALEEYYIILLQVFKIEQFLTSFVKAM
jgi:hypothetical protein